MAAETSHSHQHDVLCPDPSAHEKSNKLSEQASSAALYVTKPERATEAPQPARENPLGSDGKLSSKSAAASLKYAKAQDLPSFPSHGGSANSAGKAAMLAKDYKMKELWQPEQSLAGSKAAAAAQAKGGKLDLWQASASADGHSAATLAMRNKGLSPNAYTGVDADNRSKALLAATMSASKGRQRAGSTPAPVIPAYPDAKNSVANALSAATASHRTSTLRSTQEDGWNSDAMQAARIQNVGTNMDREMFTEHPPVEIEREEARYQAALRASAVSMAKQIYESQNRTVMAADPADVAAAQTAAGRSSTTTQPNIKEEAMRYIHLQEAAHKLAAERLAKVDKSFENSRYREYYGYDDKPKRLSNRMSLRSVGAGGRQRKRASSEGNANLDDSDDEEQARRIRSQMSQLNSGLTQVDSRKQQDDRAKLLAAAEKRVSQRMHNMDEKVFADTGKVPPALMEEWEAKARERARKDREEQAQHPGKTHIGGGKFMDQSEIEAIAAARLKPTLDEINDTAEKKRARDEEMRLEKEENERQKREEKATKKEEKDEHKRVKNEEKARKAEEKRVVKEEKRKSRDIKREEAKDAAAAGAAGAALAEVADKVKDDDGETDAQATDGVQKHRSAFGRLKEKFRRGHGAADDEDNKETSRPSTAVKTGTAATGGAATGATLAEVADHNQNAQPTPQDPQQAAHAIAHEDEDEATPVASPISPAAAPENHMIPAASSSTESEAAGSSVTDDKWRPVEAPTAAVLTDTAPSVSTPTIEIHEGDEDEIFDEQPEPKSKAERPPFEQKPSLTGYYQDEGPALLGVGKPNLERHISQIPESDGDSSDDEWEDEYEEKPRVGRTSAVAVTVAAPAANTTLATTSEEPPMPSDAMLAKLDNQRAEAPKQMAGAPETPGVPKATPTAVPETETKLETDPDQKEHTVLRQLINPHGDKYDEQAFGTTAHEVENPVTGSEEKPAKASTASTAAPVETSKLKKEPKSDAAKPPATEDQQKERKGIRGLLSKFGTKKNKESKYPEFKSVGSASSHDGTTKAVEKPATKQETPAPNLATTLPPVETGPSFGEDTGTDDVIGDKDKISGLGENPEPASPSSFQRGENPPNDLDDVSSSGADEEDLSRGRGGRLAKKLGFVRKSDDKDHATPASANARQNSNTEDEQFEEARDHFDETLAPPPAFAGQAKSESPVRETRFQEQL